ncbi:MAG: FtsQ-type POTRA domain-containing protein [Clostridium sp.]|uniref:cell division protein FtsQ/DivIB n=1 Tax=Clostridium sp. TaxID=1506 RepID=UPI002FC64363
MSVEKKKKKANKRKVLIYLSLLLIILGIVAGVGLKSSYFLISNIEVKGESIVTKEEVQVLSDLKDKNIFLINKDKVSELVKSNPYIENVNISRKLPSTVVIDVKEKKIGAIIKMKEGYVNIDEFGKMVQVVSKFPGGNLPELINTGVDKYTPNQNVFKKQEQINAFNKCSNAIASSKECTVFKKIDMTSPYDIKLYTQNETVISIGSVNNIEYKLGYAISILNSSQVKNQKGEIKILDSGSATFKKI